MRRVSSGKRLARRAAVLLLIFAFSGGAFAFFSASGKGSGGSATGTASDISASPATALAGLYPGASGELALLLSNPNPIPVRVSSLELDTSRGSGGFSVDADHAGACTTPELSFTPQSNGGSGWEMPPKVGVTDGTLTLDLAGAVSMGAAASSGCQGAAFTVYLRAVS